jgi:hypothetical protein
MLFDADKIKREMESLLASTGDFPKEKRKDIAFHMTDWLSDLQALTAFFEKPEGVEPVAFKKMLIGFLVHAPDHIAAARKLVTDQGMEDVFKVGIFEE